VKLYLANWSLTVNIAIHKTGCAFWYYLVVKQHHQPNAHLIGEALSVDKSIKMVPQSAFQFDFMFHHS
jgi:hypothetical protein